MKIVTVVPLLLLIGGCGVMAGESARATPPEVWVVSLGHSASDRAEEQAHLADFDRVLLPEAIARGAEVIVVTVGSDGSTSPRVLAEVDFDTSDVDGDNPVLRARLQAERHDELMRDVSAKAQAIPFSPASDPFGGFAAAKSLMDQFPARVPKTLVAIGDELANRPSGCVLASRDMSSPARRAALIKVCAPVVPDLADVRVALVGAGYSVDDPIDEGVADGLRALLQDYFAAAHANVILYGQVLVAPGADAGPTQPAR